MDVRHGHSSFQLWVRLQQRRTWGREIEIIYYLTDEQSMFDKCQCSQWSSTHPQTWPCCCFVGWSESVTLTLTWAVQVNGRQTAQVQPRPVLLQPALPVSGHVRGTGRLNPPLLFRRWREISLYGGRCERAGFNDKLLSGGEMRDWIKWQQTRLLEEWSQHESVKVSAQCSVTSPRNTCWTICQEWFYWCLHHCDLQPESTL